LASIGLRAGITIVAGCAIGFGGVVANADAGIARTNIVTLITGGTRYRILPDTCSGFARIGLRTTVTVIARRAVGFCRIVAKTGRCVAGACGMALVTRRTNHGIASCACTCLAGIGLRAGITIAATCPIDFVRIVTDTRDCVACANIVTRITGGARYGIVTLTCTGVTGVSLRAGIVVVATCRVVGVYTAC
jgi:hypothetical protein